MSRPARRSPSPLELPRAASPREYTTEEVQKMPFRQREQIYNSRMEWAKRTGTAMCEHPWETTTPWDGCKSGPAGFDVLEHRKCGHIVCARHILMHGALIHGQFMFGMLGVDGKPAVSNPVK